MASQTNSPSASRKKSGVSALLLAAFTFLILLALFALLYRYDNKYAAGAPYGENGVFSFSEDDLTRPLPLVDGWELYPDQLIPPAAFKANAAPPPRFTFIGQYPNFSFWEEGHSPFGSATYRLTLRYTGPAKSLVLSVPEIFTDYTLWADGEEISGAGRERLASFPAGENTELVLNVQNHSHYYSGLTYPPLLGETAVMGRVLLLQDIFYGVLCLFSLSLCLFAAVSLFTKGYDRRFTHFGLLCFFFALQTSYHFLQGMGISGVFCYALEDTARMAVLYETLALCTLECDLHTRKWYRFGVQPAAIAFCGLTAAAVLFIIPNAGALINPYGVIVDGYRILCFVYLCCCAGYGLLHGHKGSPFVLSICAAVGLSLYLNIAQNSRFEPIYTGWQTEYTTLALVLLFCFLIVRHIRDLVEANRELTGNLSAMVYRKTEDLQAVLEERKAFFSDLAHDMKAPIASIHGFVNLISRGNLYVDDVLKEYLTLIGSETDELGRRVEALTDLHSFDKIADSPEVILVNELLEQVYHDNEPEACALGVLLTIAKGNPQAAVFGVRKKLLILFENLIYNALSFTPEDGAITITAAANGDSAVITLSDTGRGIAPDKLPHIFERFYSVRENPGEGSGLGLYIVKITVEEMGGSVNVSSVLGVGTTFSLRLPLSPQGD